MSSKVKSVLAVMIMGAAFVASTTQGCGGGSSGANATEICNKVCTKIGECYGAAAGAEQVIAQCKTNCIQNVGNSSEPSTKCGNLTPTQAQAKFDLCYPMACDAFQTCAANVCSGGTTGTAGTGATGAGGTTGTAGTGSSTGAAGFAFDGSVPGFDAAILADSGLLGSGGSAGTTCATACVKAEACCKALPGANPANCTFVAQCNASTNPASTVQACNGVLQAAAFFGANTPAACK